MATSWAAATANSILDALCRNTAWTQPSAFWVKLHIGAPGSAGTSNAAANTTRKQVTFGAASGGSSANTGAVTWSTVSTTETYTHFTVWDASTSGTFLCSGTVTNGAVSSGDDFTAAIGALTVSLTLAS